MTKKIYEYSPVTGEFLAETDATPDPLKSGEYLGRVHATFVVPPETGENESAIWVGQSWEIKPDYRGKAYWLPDGTYGGEIKALGELPEGALLDKPEIQLTLSEAQVGKLEEINVACDTILNAAIANYPASEIQTFSQQTAEAQSYVSDNTAETPLLRMLAQMRGISLEELVMRVLEKHDAFSLLSGYVIGQRQALEDRLKLCKTLDEVQSIAVDIRQPEVQESLIYPAALLQGALEADESVDAIREMSMNMSAVSFPEEKISEAQEEESSEADESISACAYRKQRTRKSWYVMRCLIDTVCFWQKDYCKQAYESEQQRLK